MTASLVSPLNKLQQQRVIEHTRYYLDYAKQIFSYKARKIEICFDLSGRTAGMYRVYGWKRTIRYNPYLFAKYFTDNFETTIPHEVAHYVSDMMYGLKNIRPHGPEWQQIMHAFGADSSVTADFDLDGIPQRRQKYHCYQCACRQHEISSTRHNRILKKRTRYYCQHCRQILQPCPNI